MFTAYICGESRTSDRPTLNMVGGMFMTYGVTEINTVKFAYSAGSIDSGTIKIYGIA